jgi:hypothetical protein
VKFEKYSSKCPYYRPDLEKGATAVEEPPSILHNSVFPLDIIDHSPVLLTSPEKVVNLSSNLPSKARNGPSSSCPPLKIPKLSFKRLTVMSA